MERHVVTGSQAAVKYWLADHTTCSESEAGVYWLVPATTAYPAAKAETEAEADRVIVMDNSAACSEAMAAVKDGAAVVVYDVDRVLACAHAAGGRLFADVIRVCTAASTLVLAFEPATARSVAGDTLVATLAGGIEGVEVSDDDVQSSMGIGTVVGAQVAAWRVETLLIAPSAAPGDPWQPCAPPLYQTATFVQPGARVNGPYDYTRSGNPTRTAVLSPHTCAGGAANGDAATGGPTCAQNVWKLFLLTL